MADKNMGASVRAKLKNKAQAEGKVQFNSYSLCIGAVAVSPQYF